MPQRGAAILPTLLILGGVLLFAIFGYTTFLTFQGAFGEKVEEDLTPFPISTFEECENAGYPVGESAPRQCFAQGKTFVEEITNENTNIVIPITNTGTTNTNTSNSNTSVPTQLRCTQDSDCALNTCIGCASREWLQYAFLQQCNKYPEESYTCECTNGACITTEKTSTNSSNVNAVPIELQPTPIEGICGDDICEAGEQCQGPCYYNPETGESYCLDSCGEQYCNEDCG